MCYCCSCVATAFVVDAIGDCGGCDAAFIGFVLASVVGCQLLLCRVLPEVFLDGNGKRNDRS